MSQLPRRISTHEQLLAVNPAAALLVSLFATGCLRRAHDRIETMPIDMGMSEFYGELLDQLGIVAPDGGVHPIGTWRADRVAEIEAQYGPDAVFGAQT